MRRIWWSIAFLFGALLCGLSWVGVIFLVVAVAIAWGAPPVGPPSPRHPTRRTRP